MSALHREGLRSFAGRRVLLVATLLSLPAFAGRLPSAEDDGKPTSTAARVRPAVSTGDLRMQKRFGIGFGAAGPLAVFGIEADFNITEQISATVGFGTGVDYTSWMAEARYFLFDHWISPYLGVGLARWWTDGTKEKRLGPSALTQNLLPGGTNPENGFSLFMFYPALGVQLYHPMGFALSAEIEQLFRLFSLGNATYGGLSFHWYL
jgi:hypothetical protein